MSANTRPTVSTSAHYPVDPPFAARAGVLATTLPGVTRAVGAPPHHQGDGTRPRRTQSRAFAGLRGGPQAVIQARSPRPSADPPFVARRSSLLEDRDVDLLLGDELQQRRRPLLRSPDRPLDRRHDLARLGHPLA